MSPQPRSQAADLERQPERGPFAWLPSPALPWSELKGRLEGTTKRSKCVSLWAGQQRPPQLNKRPCQHRQKQLATKQILVSTDSMIGYLAKAKANAHEAKCLERPFWGVYRSEWFSGFIYTCSMLNQQPTTSTTSTSNRSLKAARTSCLLHATSSV